MLVRRIAPAATAAGIAFAHAHRRAHAESSSATTTNSQVVAAKYAQSLSTSDGTLYTLPYLDSSKKFSVWRRNGERSSFSEMMAAAQEHDVVLLGETHDDAIAHKLQEIIFARLAASRPHVALSLEMFETDVQHVLDEYLGGLIREQDMRNDARPWSNYDAHYRPLVEIAKAAGLPVVAANAPRRYVSAAGRDGEIDTRLRPYPRAAADLPPLPLPAPSAVYTARMHADPEVMPRAVKASDERVKAAGEKTPIGEIKLGEGCPYTGFKKGDVLLAPMKLWDCTMAYSVATALRGGRSAQVVHVCGSDHSLGIAEFIAHYASQPIATSSLAAKWPELAASAKRSSGTGPRVLIINMYPEEDCMAFVEARHAGKCDFVVLTDSPAES